MKFIISIFLFLMLSASLSANTVQSVKVDFEYGDSQYGHLADPASPLVNMECCSDQLSIDCAQCLTIGLSASFSKAYLFFTPALLVSILEPFYVSFTPKIIPIPPIV